MSMYQTQADQLLEAFMDDLQNRTESASFEEEELAAPLWTAVQPHTDQQLLLLKRAATRLDVQDQDRYDQLFNIIEFFRMTLEWSQEDDLTYIETLSETAELLLKQLKATAFLRAPQQDMLAQLLATYRRTAAQASMSASFQALDRFIPVQQSAQGEPAPPLSPPWSPLASSDRTPTHVGVYS